MRWLRVSLVFIVLLLPAGAAGRPSSLALLVSELHAGVAPAVGELVRRGHRVGLVVVSRLPADAARADELTELLARRIADVPGSADAPETMPRTVLSAAADLPSAAIREARRAGWTRLLVVVAAVHDGRLVLSGELFATDHWLWGDGARPVGGVAGHVFAARRLDAELRTRLGLPRPAGKRVWRSSGLTIDGLKGLTGRVLALAVGDVDGDRDDELLLLTRGELLVMEAEPRPNELRTVARANLGDLPRAEVVSREPAGSLYLTDLSGDGQPELLLTTTDLRHGQVWTWGPGGLRVLPSTAASPLCDDTPADGTSAAFCGVPVGEIGSGQLAFQPLLRGRPTAAEEILLWHPGGSPDRLSEAALAASDGAWIRWVPGPGSESWRPLVATLDGRGTLRIYRDHPSPLPWCTLEGTGFAVALADLDDDGAPEVATAADGTASQADRLRIVRLRAEGQTATLWESAMAPIQALAAGDTDLDGRLELVAATWEPALDRSELLVVRWEVP